MSEVSHVPTERRRSVRVETANADADAGPTAIGRPVAQSAHEHRD
ncbi:hypothetical protein [Halogeometricum limi]|nr:hypothetical protein [Halogeometricum limi]